MLPRSVIFIDPPAFCTTLEGLVAPALRSRPLAVAAPGADRATVLALSPEARLAGIARGMAVHRARKVCPDLILLPPNPRLYARASRALHEIFRQYAPVIEPRGYGHAFLDLTGTARLFGPPVDVASRIQHEAQERVRLPVSVGVATNKLVSQAATTVAKEETAGSRSDASWPILQVPLGGEAMFLAPQRVEVLPDLGPKTLQRLDDYQLELIGDVAALEERQVCAVFPSEGPILLARARGVDPRPVLPPERKAEFRATHTLASDTNDLGLLHALLRRLAEQLGHRLRLRQLVARRLTVSLAYADYATARQSLPLVMETGTLDVELWDAARRAFTQANRRTVALRAVGVKVDRFLEADVQMELWGNREGSGREALQRALDQVRVVNGVNAVNGKRSTGVVTARSPFTVHQVKTTFPNVSSRSMTMCASARSVIG
jgi:DNA polymerase-4